MLARAFLERLLLAASLSLVGACAGGPTSEPVGSPAVTLELVAENIQFAPRDLQVVAGAPFAIRLENRDAVPHNVAVNGPKTEAGEIFGGPAERIENFSALPAGTYEFLCEVHPEMTGTITSR